MKERMTGKIIFCFFFLFSEIRNKIIRQRFRKKEDEKFGGLSHLLRSCLVIQQKMLLSVVIHFTTENATVAVYCEVIEDLEVKALLLPKKKKKKEWVSIFLYEMYNKPLS